VRTGYRSGAWNIAIDKIRKTEEERKAQLTPEQYKVSRRAGEA
jgi:hypothetical protein